MLRTFRGIRPTPQKAQAVASFPYDVIDSLEARELVKSNPYSFLHVVKSEVDLPEDTDLYDNKVYLKARENFDRFLKEKTLIQDTKPSLYIYKQEMNGHAQYGLVGCVSANEYNDNIIKKHELTRKAKEDDRTRHVLSVNANTGPVFLTYRDQDQITSLVHHYAHSNQPDYDFIKEDGIKHTFWVIRDDSVQHKLIEQFKSINALYVADGHHRSASAARAKKERWELDSNPNEEKEYNFFLAVLFPASELKIMDYNRVVADLNGLSPSNFLHQVQEKFELTPSQNPHPRQSTEFGMYFQGQWYQLKAKLGTYPANDPVESLDVAILQNNLLSPILGIGDPRVDNRIDFVGGIRGHQELEKRVNDGKAAVAFKLFPTSIDQLLSVADANKIMPPKSTWFEPKLRSGLIIHSLE